MIVAVANRLHAEVNEVGGSHERDDREHHHRFGDDRPDAHDTAVMAGSMQSALPTTLSTPPFRSRDSDLPMTNSTLGPGNRISASAATENAQALVAGSAGTPIGGRVLFERSAVCGRI